MDQTSFDPNQLALTVLQYATSGNWRALAALGIVVGVFAIRTWVLAPAALGRYKALAWFKTDRGGVALNFIVSGLGGLGTVLAAHAVITKELVLTAIVNSCIAAGVFVSIKRLAGRPAAVPVAPAPVAVAPTDPAADAAITTTTTTEQPK